MRDRRPKSEPIVVYESTVYENEQPLRNEMRMHTRQKKGASVSAVSRMINL
jgi:hypothetical protein